MRPEDYQPWDDEDYEAEERRMKRLGIITDDNGGDGDDD